MVKAIPTDEIDNEEALYGDGQDGIFADDRGNIKQKKKRRNQDDDCKVIKEKDFKQGRSVKAVVEVSKDDSKNPQPFYLKLIPFVDSILKLITSSGSKDPFETTVEITSLFSMEFINEMDKRYNTMNSAITPINSYNVMKDSNIKIPHTEVFTDEEYKKLKVKVMVSAGVNSWIHKYCEAFDIEKSDVFSAFVLYSYYNKKGVDEESKQRCKDKLDIFYNHIDNKIEKLSDAPPEFNSIIPYYLDLLQAVGIEQKTIYIEHSLLKGKVIFIPDGSLVDSNNRKRVDEYQKDPFYKKKRGRKPRKVVTEDEIRNGDTDESKQ